MDSQFVGGKSPTIVNEDKRFYKDDPNFNPAKNKAIIQETINETEAYFRQLNELQDKDLENRVDILSTYARYRFNKGFKDLESYIGREQYEKLVGEKILDKVKRMDTINRLGGNDKYKKFIQL